MPWDSFRRIAKTRTTHTCACTGREIPIGSSCWQWVGKFEYDFQSWYMSDVAKDFYELNKSWLCGKDGFYCESIGEAMKEEGLI